MRLGNYNSASYQNITGLPGSSYLNACFAKDSNSDNVIHLSQSNRFLVIHQDVLGRSSKAIIPRIDTVQNKIWETATGMCAKISNCHIKGRYCVLIGNVKYVFTPNTGSDGLVIIDVENGKLIMPSLNL